ncbi:MAG: insulinase family protein [Bdellovibrionaceae bacterium]|nr:insulinase family protein [Pseudobdellovibrionaceae bacterium]
MIHEFTAENGLKVIGIESHKSPVVSVQIWVRNGSADERSGEEGISHFIEHLLFKGTRKFKVGEIASMVEACGGEINAYTSYDQTVYYITISKNFFPRAMEAIYEMIAHPLFDKDEIDKEREVVIEEIKRSNDSLSRRASRLLFSSMYENYPYQIPVIGYDHVVNTVTQDHIKKFFQARYATDNMFLVVSGDFQPEDLKKEFKNTFGQISKGSPEKRPRGPIKMIDKKTVKIEKTPFEDAVMYMSWPGVDIQHKDVAALECLGLILGQGASSRLVTKLRMEEPLVKSIGAGSWTPTTRGFFSISSTFNPANLTKVLAGIKSVLEAFFDKGISADELYKAKINFLSDEAYSLETVGGLAQKFGGNFEASNDIYFHKKFYKDLENVSAEDIMRVAQVYLQPETMLVAYVSPEEPDKVQPLLEQWSFNKKTNSKASTEKPAISFVGASAGTDLAAPMKVVKHSGGARTFFMKNNTAPVFNLRMAVLGGSRVVPKEKAGLSELTSRVWGAQTKKFSEAVLRDNMDKLASSVYSFNGKNTFGLVVDGLKQSEKQLAELFQEILFNYDISDEILQREKLMIKESLRARKDSPAQMAILAFNKAMFANHPYGIDSLNEGDSLDGLTVEDVKTYIQTNLLSGNMVSAICGDASEELWLPLLEKTSTTFNKAGDKKLFSIAPLDKNVWLYESSQKEQAHVVYGFRGVTITSAERFTLQVIEAVLAGQGGRLFLELRDKASLAYSVSPLKLEGVETGYFATYIGCSPEKTETALKMMKEELMKLAEQEIPEVELQRAKNYLIGGHDIGLQKNSAIASSVAFNEIYGLSADEVFRYERTLAPITTKHVRELAEKIFKQKHVISIVGSQEPSKITWL